MDKLNNNIETIELEVLLTYQKLKIENKEFVKKTINHLYNMQNKR